MKSESRLLDGTSVKLRLERVLVISHLQDASVRLGAAPMQRRKCSIPINSSMFLLPESSWMAFPTISLLWKAVERTRNPLLLNPRFTNCQSTMHSPSRRRVSVFIDSGISEPARLSRTSNCSLTMRDSSSRSQEEPFLTINSGRKWETHDMWRKRYNFINLNMKTYNFV